MNDFVGTDLPVDVALAEHGSTNHEDHGGRTSPAHLDDVDSKIYMKAECHPPMGEVVVHGTGQLGADIVVNADGYQ